MRPKLLMILAGLFVLVAALAAYCMSEAQIQDDMPEKERVFVPFFPPEGTNLVFWNFLEIACERLGSRKSNPSAASQDGTSPFCDQISITNYRPKE